MTTMTDHELLRQYARTGSQEAFAELVSHHADWIYSAALRLVRRRDWAEDVTQAVFIVLSKRAEKVPQSGLNRWLFKVMRYCASDILRGENRREKRERQAAIMNSEIRNSADDAKWDEISPVLEQSVAELREADRDAVLLRFYQQKSMAEVGQALGISEEAARKRVGRAVEALRTRMTMQGVVMPAAGAAIALLGERTTHAAPAGLGTSCIPGSGTSAALNVAAHVNQILVAMKVKVAAIAIVLLAMIPAAAWMGMILLQSPQSSPPPAQGQATATPASAPPRTMAVDDAAIGPFSTSLTQIIVSMDFSRFDLPSLRAEENAALASILPAGDERLPQMRRSVEQYNKRIEDASRALQAQAGIHFYPMVAAMGPNNYAGFFVLPAGENVVALQRLIGLAPARTPDGNACVYGGKQTSAMIVSRMLKAPKNPDLAEALGAGPDAAVRAVVNPEFFRMLADGISTPRAMGLGDMSEPQWQKVKWLRMSVDAPPNLSGSAILHCKDSDSAAALAALLKSKFAAIAADTPEDAVPARVAELIAHVSPMVSGSDVTIGFDRTTMEAILLDWFVGTEHRPTPPPRKIRQARPATENAGM